MTFQTVELLLQELGDFTVNMLELELLKQYHSDAIFWIARLNDILVNINGRKDQHNVIDELNCILKEGASLRIQGFFLLICNFLVTVPSLPIFCFHFMSP